MGAQYQMSIENPWFPVGFPFSDIENCNNKKPSETQTEKILHGIHQIGQELSETLKIRTLMTLI